MVASLRSLQRAWAEAGWGGGGTWGPWRLAAVQEDQTDAMSALSRAGPPRTGASSSSSVACGDAPPTCVPAPVRIQTSGAAAALRETGPYHHYVESARKTGGSLGLWEMRPGSCPSCCRVAAGPCLWFEGQTEASTVLARRQYETGGM